MSGRRAVVGDASSVSRAGSVTAHGGVRLAQVAPMSPALDGLDGWVGAAARGTRARATALEHAAVATAAELSAAGTLLQAHATTLAGALAGIQAIAVRAQSAGLHVNEDRVVLRPGLRGEADASDEQRVRVTQQTLDAELAKLLREFRSARTQLRTAMARSQERLAEVAGAVRRGTDIR